MEGREEEELETEVFMSHEVFNQTTEEYSEWIGRGLKLFNEGMIKYLEKASLISRDKKPDTIELLKLLQTHWYQLNQPPMTWYEKSLFSELRHIRNSWAHQMNFNAHDTYRSLDTIERIISLLHIYDIFFELRNVKMRFLPYVYKDMKRPLSRDSLVSKHMRNRKIDFF
jgi:hypothetical protein